jgi:DNA-directed RNA polymerase subunit beta
VRDGKVTDKIVHLDATQEEEEVIAQANTPLGEDGTLLGDEILCRTQSGHYVTATGPEVDLVDVSPEQLWSVATAMIPFLEHDDANARLMARTCSGRRCRCCKTDAPLIGTGMERRAGDRTRATWSWPGTDGTVEFVDATSIVVTTADGRDEYELQKFMRSNQGTLIHQKPLVKVGPQVEAGDVLGRTARPPTWARWPWARTSGRLHVLGGLQLRGRDHPLRSGLVKDDELTSIHIEEYEIDARTTKLGDEEITRDIPNRSEESLRNLDDRGIVRIGAEVQSGDLLVGKVTPKGETELTAEEKLIRAIFKEKAREVRDTSLKVPHGEGGVVIDVKTFSARPATTCRPGVNELVRVFVAKKRKIAEGDKLAGRHGNKGVISKIVPEEDMPFLEDGTPVDVILNPLGVPSRMNIGQILETHLGWVAAQGWYADGTRPTERECRTPTGKRARSTSPRPCSTAPRSRTSTRPRAVAEGAHSGRIRMDSTSRAARASRPRASAALNGRTASPFEQTVTVGYMYILKLLHLVDDKIHARSPARTRSSPSSRWAARRSSAASASARWRSGRSRPTAPRTRCRRC